MTKIKKRYKFAVIATDIVIFTIKDSKLQVLLIKMKKKPYENCWAAPGGLIQPNESVNEAAKRLLKDKAGVKNVYLEQLYTFGKVDRDPFGRVVSVAYFALVPEAKHNPKTTKEYDDIRWFPINSLPRLAYDHKEMTSLSLERLQAKLGYTNIVYSLLPNFFTLSELQEIYEIILGKKLDKRNFRKKVHQVKLVKKTGKTTLGAPNRPAELYKFASKKPEIIDVL